MSEEYMCHCGDILDFSEAHQCACCHEYFCSHCCPTDRSFCFMCKTDRIDYLKDFVPQVFSRYGITFVSVMPNINTFGELEYFDYECMMVDYDKFLRPDNFNSYADLPKYFKLFKDGKVKLHFHQRDVFIEAMEEQYKNIANEIYGFLQEFLDHIMFEFY
jgi:hypothetical protein